MFLLIYKGLVLFSNHTSIIKTNRTSEQHHQVKLPAPRYDEEGNLYLFTAHDSIPWLKKYKAVMEYDGELSEFSAGGLDYRSVYDREETNEKRIQRHRSNHEFIVFSNQTITAFSSNGIASISANTSIHKVVYGVDELAGGDNYFFTTDDPVLEEDMDYLLSKDCDLQTAFDKLTLAVDIGSFYDIKGFWLPNVDNQCLNTGKMKEYKTLEGYSLLGKIEVMRAIFNKEPDSNVKKISLEACEETPHVLARQLGFKSAYKLKDIL